jgi:hypothetical protein
MERVIEMLWKWIVLAESALLERLTRIESLNQAEQIIEGLREAEQRAKALAELERALRELGLAVPTIEELRAEWDAAEARGRARSPWSAEQIEYVKADDKPEE